MSDQKQIDEKELDKASGGVGSHPVRTDPVGPERPTHPGGPVTDPLPPIRSNPIERG